ncbi:MAG: hypothetical protein ACREBU_16265, partial [Nitrososphaera sp.]
LVLFDLDGTLSDPLVGIGRSINYALSHFGYEPCRAGETRAAGFAGIAARVAPALLNFMSKHSDDNYISFAVALNIGYQGVTVIDEQVTIDSHTGEISLIVGGGCRT